MFSDGRVLELDNFRVLTGNGWSDFRKFKLGRQDKGHVAECDQFVRRVGQGGDPLIPFEQLVNVTRASFQAETLSTDRPAEPAMA